MLLTRIDLNSWILKLAERTILIDPWLVDPLAFFGLPWLAQLRHRRPPAFSPETLPSIDLLLLSQGQDDHCHRPTLAQLDKRIPVIASAAAAQAARSLGFQEVTGLDPWRQINLGDLRITAVPGAQLGPTRENGYLLQDPTGRTLYYEPHEIESETQQKLAQRTAIDVLLIPVVGQIFPLLGEVIMGPDRALAAAQILRPKAIVPTALGEVEMSGILTGSIRSVGSLTEFAQKLLESDLSARFITPDPGETLDLSRILSEPLLN